MPLTTSQIEEQKRQAEELLGADEHLGFAKSLFFGQFQANLLFPYPELSPHEAARVEQTLSAVRQFCYERIDPAAIDRNADIPPDVVAEWTCALQVRKAIPMRGCQHRQTYGIEHHPVTGETMRDDIAVLVF